MIEQAGMLIKHRSLLLYILEIIILKFNKAHDYLIEKHTLLKPDSNQHFIDSISKKETRAKFL